MLPAFATRLSTLLPAFIAFGVGMGLTDTAMNAHAVTVEQRYARPVMSSFHGFASGLLARTPHELLFTADLALPPDVDTCDGEGAEYRGDDGNDCRNGCSALPVCGEARCEGHERGHNRRPSGKAGRGHAPAPTAA
jgi:hypothetical protein